MSRDSIEGSRELLAQTHGVLEGLRSRLPDEEMDPLLERQRDAFSAFSRHTDTEAPLDSVSQENVDSVLHLEETIVELLHEQGEALMRESRSITNSRQVAKAFYSKPQDPPQFITRHV